MQITHLKLGYRSFAVRKANASDEADNGRDAYINHRKAIIVVADDQPDERVAYLIVHEVLHGLLRDAAMEWPNDDEEKFVARLTPRMTAFFADNPEQVRALLEMLA